MRNIYFEQTEVYQSKGNLIGKMAADNMQLLGCRDFARSRSVCKRLLGYISVAFLAS